MIVFKSAASLITTVGLSASSAQRLQIANSFDLSSLQQRGPTYNINRPPLRKERMQISGDYENLDASKISLINKKKKDLYQSITDKTIELLERANGRESLIALTRELKEFIDSEIIYTELNDIHPHSQNEIQKLAIPFLEIVTERKLYSIKQIKDVEDLLINNVDKDISLIELVGLFEYFIHLKETEIQKIKEVFSEIPEGLLEKGASLMEESRSFVQRIIHKIPRKLRLEADSIFKHISEELEEKIGELRSSITFTSSPFSPQQERSIERNYHTYLENFKKSFQNEGARHLKEFKEKWNKNISSISSRFSEVKVVSELSEKLHSTSEELKEDFSQIWNEEKVSLEKSATLLENNKQQKISKLIVNKVTSHQTDSLISQMNLIDEITPEEKRKIERLITSGFTEEDGTIDTAFLKSFSEKAKRLNKELNENLSNIEDTDLYRRCYDNSRWWESVLLNLSMVCSGYVAGFSIGKLIQGGTLSSHEVLTLLTALTTMAEVTGILVAMSNSNVGLLIANLALFIIQHVVIPKLRKLGGTKELNW